MALVNPQLYLEIEHLRSKARATSIFLSSDPSNAILATIDSPPASLNLEYYLLRFTP